MREHLKNEMNMAYTENGAVTRRSTGSCCLDLFATAGALRKRPDEDILDRFTRAYREDRNAAMKLLFFSRDVRGGLGERRLFRICLNWLAARHPESVIKNIPYIAEYGRWDDIISLIGTPCEEEAVKAVSAQLKKDLEAMTAGGEVSLVAKWLPSANASSRQTRHMGVRMASLLGMTDREYRKTLSALRGHIRIIENSLRTKDYSFDYSKQPSRAMYKYRKAFIRNDSERYLSFLDSVRRGEKTLTAANVSPYELVQPYLSGYGRRLSSLSAEERKALNATWDCLPDFGTDDNALAVIDTSGSMYDNWGVMPAAVALSLGIYLAERSRGPYRGCFIEFSRTPQLIELKGEDFVSKLEYAASFCEMANTNLQAVFDVILNAAVRNNVPREDMPGRLVIISDMEFDRCMDDAELTNFTYAKVRYARKGYDLPKVVFWNVASRNRHQPVSKDEKGVTLVSGATPRLFEMVAGGSESPYRFMMEVLSSERYAPITA